MATKYPNVQAREGQSELAFMNWVIAGSLSSTKSETGLILG